MKSLGAGHLVLLRACALTSPRTYMISSYVRFVQTMIRAHTYHLIITASSHRALVDAGLPARGLSGEGYRGHVFWDEV